MGGGIVFKPAGRLGIFLTHKPLKSTPHDTHFLCEEFPMVPLENSDAQTFTIANFGHPVSKSWLRSWKAGHYIAMLCVFSLGKQKHGVAGVGSSIFFCY